MSERAPIDWAGLSLMDALDLAVLIEEQARERYQDLAHHMEHRRDPEFVELFRSLAHTEAQHETRLAGKRAVLFGLARRNVRREQLDEVEAPQRGDAILFATRRDALEMALRAEERAHAFFAAALERVEDPEVRALFTELRDEEVEHQERIRRQLALLPEQP